MNGVKDVFIVEVDRPSEDLIDCGGVELQLDTNFRPEENARIYGVVKGLPMSYSCLDKQGQVELEDTVYFHYNEIATSQIEGRLYAIDFDRVIAVEKGDCKCLHAVGDWCLLKPHSEYGERELVDGKMLELRKKGNLVVGLGEKQSAVTARVSYIRENDMNVHPGDIVAMEPGFEFKNKIKGEDYFCNKQEYILAIM